MTTTDESTLGADGEKSPEQLQREIDEQRSSIGQIVDALERKMSPGQWVDQVLAYTRQNGGEFAGNLGQSLRQNPVPAVLMSVSLAWLMLGQRQAPDGGESMHESLHETVDDALGSARDTMQSAASRLKDKAGQWTPDKDTIRHLKARGQRLQSGLTDVLHRQPLALAGMAVALGAALGQSLPPVERQWHRHASPSNTQAGPL